MKEFLDGIHNQSDFQGLFFQNLVKIVLCDSLIPDTHLDIVCLIFFENLNTNDFEQSILWFMENKRLLPLLHQLFELFLKSNLNKENIFEIISANNLENVDEPADSENSESESQNSSEKNKPV